MRLGLLAGRFDYQPSGILDDTHLRFFTRESAMRLCESAGLEVLTLAQNPMLLRAAKDLILKAMVHEGAAPTELLRVLLATRRTRPSSARSRTSWPTAPPASSPSRTCCSRGSARVLAR